MCAVPSGQDQEQRQQHDQEQQQEQQQQQQQEQQQRQSEVYGYISPLNTDHWTQCRTIKHRCGSVSVGSEDG
jgi:type II secretory pathway pseudopilin PulG